MNDVFATYMWTSTWVLVEILFSWGLAKTVIRRWPRFVTRICKFLLIVTGTAFLLIAGVAELGWEIVTLEGDSPAEDLNKYLFWIFSMFGGFLVFLELFLAHLAEK